MQKLAAEQITRRLEDFDAWSQTAGKIQRTFLFEDFVQAMKFVNQIAEEAEHDQHHPDILVRYNKVTLTLSTHDAGGITEKDFALAMKCDRLAG